jgi:hypothetical protein
VILTASGESAEHAIGVGSYLEAEFLTEEDEGVSVVLSPSEVCG